MIHGELRAVGDRTNRTVVDGKGKKIVCVVSVKRGDKIYHEIDIDEWEETGEILPECSEQLEHGGMRPVPLADLGGQFRRCRWHHCGGDHMKTDGGTQPGTKQLTSLLERLSVDQFDRIRSENQPGGILHGKY